MSDTNLPPHLRSPAAAGVSYEDGLRNFMMGTYGRVTIALLLTALLAYIASQPPLAQLIHGVGKNGKPTFTILGLVVAFAPLAVILLFSLMGAARTVTGSTAMLYIVAALFGLSMGAIVLTYTAASLALTFLVTAGAFAGLSLFGYTTKINLGAIGSAALMLLFGLIILMIANMFMKSSVIEVVITIAGLGIFAVLTAVDTQKMKESYHYNRHDDYALQVESNNAALNLYLDFVNMFLFLLRLLGEKK